MIRETRRSQGSIIKMDVIIYSLKKKQLLRRHNPLSACKMLPPVILFLNSLCGSVYGLFHFLCLSWPEFKDSYHPIWLIIESFFLKKKAG